VPVTDTETETSSKLTRSVYQERNGANGYTAASKRSSIRIKYVEWRIEGVPEWSGRNAC
jgi:hypothetical protein